MFSKIGLDIEIQDPSITFYSVYSEQMRLQWRNTSFAKIQKIPLMFVIIYHQEGTFKIGLKARRGFIEGWIEKRLNLIFNEM